MKFGELKTLVGSFLEARVLATEIPGVGLYYDALPANHERLVVRFWFPSYPTAGRAYDAPSIERPLLQIDVKHFPPEGSVQTPPPGQAETLWEAVKFDVLPGVGCSRTNNCRAPIRDPRDRVRDTTDYALWGFLQYQLTL